MGGALLAANTNAETALGRAAAMLKEQGLGAPTRLTAGNNVLLAYPRKGEDTASVLHLPNGDFLASAGSLIYKGRRDVEALRCLARDFDGDWAILDQAIGQFELVVARDGNLEFGTDRLSAGFVYLADGVACTTFLGAAAAARRRTLSSQSVYEYVLTGGLTGDETLLAEVRALPRRAVLRMQRDGSASVIEHDQGLTPPDDAFAEDLLHSNLDVLRGITAQTAQAFEGRLVCPLTGGYDSRLMLALLLEAGHEPVTYVYGESGPDVEVARAVAARAKLELMVIPPGDVEVLAPGQYAWRVHQNFLHSDGPHYDGIFHNNVEHFARREPFQSMASWHGAGGEVYRNFFLLPPRPLMPEHLATLMYGKFDRRVCTERFDFSAFVTHIGSKMRALLPEAASGKVDRYKIEWLYPAFRGRGWWARLNSVSNMAFPVLHPFYETTVIAAASRIPLCLKNYGDFEAEMIRRVHPEIAAVPSHYGHDFATQPPRRRRAVEAVKVQIPPTARPYLYAARSRFRGRSYVPTNYLSEPYVKEVLGDGPRRTASLFHLDRMQDAAQYARAMNVEYVAERLGACTDWA